MFLINFGLVGCIGRLICVPFCSCSVDAHSCLFLDAYDDFSALPIVLGSEGLFSILLGVVVVALS